MLFEFEFLIMSKKIQNMICVSLFNKEVSVCKENYLFCFNYMNSVGMLRLDKQMGKKCFVWFGVKFYCN